MTRFHVAASAAAATALSPAAPVSMARVPLLSFPVAVHFPSDGLRTDLGFPSTEHGLVACGDAPLVVRLDAAGGMTLNRVPFTRSELRGELSRRLEVRESKGLVIDFGRDVEYAAALEAMTMLQSFGAGEFVLMPSDWSSTRSHLPLSTH